MVESPIFPPPACRARCNRKGEFSKFPFKYHASSLTTGETPECLPFYATEHLRWCYHSVLISRLAFCAFILFLYREPQLRTPMAVITASFSSASSECLSNRLFKIAIAFWYSITTGQTSGCLIQMDVEHPSGKTSLSILPQKCTSVHW